MFHTLVRAGRSLPCVAILCSGACYAYIPAPTGRSVIGSDVQLALTDSGTVVLAPAVGPSTGIVEGRLVDDSAANYVLSLTKTARRDGAETDWRGERVVIPRALVATVGERRFSRGRTMLFGGLTTAALVGIAAAFAGGGGASVPGGTPTGPPTGK